MTDGVNTEQREQSTDELAALVRAGIFSGIGASGNGCPADVALDALLARLSAVEQANEHLQLALSLLGNYNETLGALTTAWLAIDELPAGVLAAEARVEALEAALREIADDVTGAHDLKSRRVARAVLAPSQQEEK